MWHQPNEFITRKFAKFSRSTQLKNGDTNRVVKKEKTYECVPYAKVYANASELIRFTWSLAIAAMIEMTRDIPEIKNISNLTFYNKGIFGQSYKQFMIVIYNSRVVHTRNVPSVPTSY